MKRKRSGLAKILVLLTALSLVSFILIYAGAGRFLISLGEKIISAGRYTEKVEEGVKKKTSDIERKAEGWIERAKELTKEIERKAD